MNNDDFKSYAGFTIGPIYDVMRHSKKTRELWFGSYFFSWYMEKLTAALSNGHGDIKFLTPYVEEEYKKPNCSLGGKFHDRFVLVSKSLDPEELYKKIESANEKNLDFFSTIIEKLKNKLLKNKKIEDIKQDSNEILKGYLQARFFTMSSDQIKCDCKEKDKTVVAVVDEYLNTMEDAFIFSTGKSEKTCQRCKTLPGIIRDIEIEKKENIILCPICFLKYRSNIVEELIARVTQTLGSDKKLNYPYIKNKKSIIYPSIQKIAASHIFADNQFVKELGDNDADEISDNEINKILKKLGKEPLKPFHKYFAVVQADGDNLGKLAKEMADGSQELDALSKSLFEFAACAEKKITDFGGVPIFLGGDDILAFMPVYYNGCTIIDFIKVLDKEYSQCVDCNKGKTTLSFGVNMAYYKFPLNIATGMAASLLFEDAKKSSKNEKNKVAICLTMHSGAEAKTVLSIRGNKFEIFSGLLKGVMQEKIKLPRGIVYNLGRFNKLLSNIPEKERMEAFFNNNFEHEKRDSYEKGIKESLKLICSYLYDEPTGKKKSGINSLKEIDSALKLLKIIRFLTTTEEK